MSACGLARTQAPRYTKGMREKTDLDREFVVHERVCFAEQARMYRALTDEERLARYIEWSKSTPFEHPPEVLARVRKIRDIERDEVLRRLADALG